MFWLILAIILSTAFAQVMKWAVARGCSTAQVGAVNYLVASTAAAAAGWLTSRLDFDRRIIAIGLLGGLSYAVAIVCIFRVIRSAGVAIAGTLMRMSVMVAVVGAIFLFHEMPTPAQWVGIVLTTVTFPLLKPGGDGATQGKAGWGVLIGMILLVVSNGTGFLAWKMVHAYGCGEQSFEFLCLLFGIPMVTCAAESGVRREGITRAAIMIGIILGVCNICSVRTSLEGLRAIPAVIFFPLYSCGGVILNAAVAMGFWRERLTRRNMIGFAVGCVALVCMNPS